MKSIKIAILFILFLISESGAAPNIDEISPSIVKLKYKGMHATGFLISRDGHIFTCGHLFLNKENPDEEIDPSKLSAQLFYPSDYLTKVEVLHIKKPGLNGPLRNHYHEYAIIKIDKDAVKNRHPFSFANPQQDLVGETLYFCSTGATNSPRVGKGFVFSYDGSIILLTPAFHPGDSGSPLLNKQGKVVGVCFANQEVVITPGFPPLRMGGGLSTPGIIAILPEPAAKTLDVRD